MKPGKLFLLTMALLALNSCSSAKPKPDQTREVEQFFEWTPYCSLNAVTQVKTCVWCKRYPLRNLEGQYTSFEQVCR